MESYIVEKVKKVAEDFIERFLGIEKELKTNVKQQEIEFAKLKKERADLKAQVTENDHKLTLSKDDLAKVKEVFKKKIVDVNEEVKKYQELERLTEKKLNEADKKLKDAKIEQTLTSEVLEQAKNKERKFATKLDKLRLDDKTLDDKRNDLNNRENKVAVREKVIGGKEQKLVDDRKALEERELDLKILEKNLKIEKKRTMAK